MLVGDRGLMQSGMRTGNEEQVSIMDPTGDARITVDPIEANELMPQNVIPMQAGGEVSLLNSMIGRTGIDWLDMARRFNQQSAQAGLARSPWGRFPSPVEVSAPGTDPMLQEIAAGLTATGTGIPRRAFLNEILKVRPAGMPQYIQRRTA